MDCINKSHPKWKELIAKYDEFTAIEKFIEYVDKQKLKETSNIKSGVQELFESNPELANQVYEAAGFDNLIEPTDRIIWGHPTIGKTTAKQEKDFLDFDTDFKPLVAKKLGLPESQQNSLGLNEWRKTNNEEDFNKAMTILVDAVNKKADTIPHEYAHHYIAWFRDTAIVQEGIKRFGSEEALVQAIGEQVIKQKGEAYNWWKKFTNWILNLLSDKQLLQILTDSFLNRQDLNDFTYKNVGKKFSSEENNEQLFFNTINSEEAKQVTEFDKFVEKEMLKVLKSLGLKVKGVRKQFSYDNVPNTATAFFDASNWLVEYHRGRATKETLPEEGAHAYLWLYRMYDQEGYDNLLAKALEEYKDRFDEDSFMGTPEEHQFEILGRILRDKLLEKLENKYKEGGIWDKILKFIFDIFNISGTTAEEIMDSMAENILNYNGNILEDLQDNIDKTYTKFTESFVKVEEFERLPGRDNKYFVKSRNNPKVMFDTTNISSLLMYAKYRDEVNKKTSKMIFPKELNWDVYASRPGRRVRDYNVEYLKKEIADKKEFFKLNSKINELFKDKKITEFEDWITYQYVFKIIFHNITLPSIISELKEYNEEQWVNEIMKQLNDDFRNTKNILEFYNIDDFDRETKEVEDFLEWFPDLLEDGVANNYEIIKEFVQLISENIQIATKEITPPYSPYFYYMKKSKDKYTIQMMNMDKMTNNYNIPNSKIIRRVSMRDIFQGKKSYMFEGENLNKKLYDNRVYKIFDRFIGNEKTFKFKLDSLKILGRDLFRMQQLLPIVNAHNYNMSRYDDKFGPRREYQDGDFLPMVTTDGFAVMSDDFSDKNYRNIYFNTTEDVGQKGAVYIGNFSEEGKGTFEGDGKDKQMRKDSVGFIGELNPSKKDRFESSTYGSFKHFSNENTIEEDRYLQSLPDEIKQGDKIMLALNGSINDKDILKKTKEKISELNEQGVIFLMGDMPHSKVRLGDSNFLNYIRSIKGKYIVYGNGSKSRIDNLKPNELEDVTQEEWDNLTEQEKNKIMECL